jgi:flagellar motor switch protein FliN
MAAQGISSRKLPRVVVEHLAAVLSARLGTGVQTRRADVSGQAAWVLQAHDDADVPSRVAVGLGDDDVSVLVAQLGHADAERGQAELLLSDIWSACLGRIGIDTGTGWSGSVSPVSEAVPTWTGAYRLDGAGFGLLALTAAQGVSARDGRTSGAGAHDGVRAAPPNLEVILDIDLPLAVRFGGTEMTIDALSRLGPGALIDLGRSPDEPVDVLVNGRMVARGEVVVVGGNYGVRVTEVVSAADRLRSMGM